MKELFKFSNVKLTFPQQSLLKTPGRLTNFVTENTLQHQTICEMGTASSSSSSLRSKVGTTTPDAEDQRLGQRQWCRLILKWQTNPFVEAPPPLPNGQSPPSTEPSPIAQFANFFEKYPGLVKFMGGMIVRYWSCGMVENHKRNVPLVWFV